jgi:hypothetical protein
MTRRIFKSARSAPGLLPLVILAAGCAGPVTTGLVLGSEGRPLPSGIDPARIVEIDGETVPWSRSGHRLAPGRHLIRVVPRVAGPTEQVPSAEALATRWPNEPVVIDVVAGHTYVVGLRMIERLETAGRRGRWEAVVVRVSGDAG